MSDLKMTDPITIGSAIVYIAAFLIALFFLTKKKMGLEKYVLAAACVISGARFYELIFHYLFSGSLNQLFTQDIWSVSLNVPTCANLAVCPLNLGPFPIIGVLLVVAMPFMYYKKMSFNSLFACTLIVVALIWGFWLAIGYPQYWNPQWFPQSTPAIVIVQNNVPNIMFWGLVMAMAAKLTCLLPALLFWEGDKTSVHEEKRQTEPHTGTYGKPGFLANAGKRIKARLRAIGKA